MDRVYLPQADLVRHGIGRHQLLAAGAGLQETPAFRALMAEQVQRARQAYAEAFALLPPADRRRQRPGLIMAAIYSALLDEIERAPPWPPFRGILNSGGITYRVHRLSHPPCRIPGQGPPAPSTIRGSYHASCIITL